MANFSRETTMDNPIEMRCISDLNYGRNNVTHTLVPDSSYTQLPKEGQVPIHFWISSIAGSE